MISRLADADVRTLRSASFTYPEQGGTRYDLPPGYQTLDISRTIGAGSATFAAATSALLSWGMHDRAGLRPRTDGAEIVEGSVAVLRFGWGRLSLPIPVRVVYVVDEPRRRGFAYGTLPGHPEQGEELFVLDWQADDAVVATITAFSRPGRWYTRVGGPLARAVQRRATERYFQALRAAAEGREPGCEDGLDYQRNEGGDGGWDGGGEQQQASNRLLAEGAGPAHRRGVRAPAGRPRSDPSAVAGDEPARPR